MLLKINAFCNIIHLIKINYAEHENTIVIHSYTFIYIFSQNYNNKLRNLTP